MKITTEQPSGRRFSLSVDKWVDRVLIAVVAGPLLIADDQIRSAAVAFGRALIEMIFSA